MAKINPTTIAQKFIDYMKNGVQDDGTWIRPWDLIGMFPTNAKTGKKYRGANAFMLYMLGGGVFATYKQWQDIGVQVTSEAKGQGIPILVPWFKKDDEGNQKLVNFRSAIVFSEKYVEGYQNPYKAKLEDRVFNPINAAEETIQDSGANIEHGGDQAFYAPSMDKIVMPEKIQFEYEEDYYSTILHELVHWTGHATRLDRELNQSRFGNEAYAFEELVAELGSCFLCAELGIHPGFRDNHAKYVKGWINILENDSKAIMKAATLAQDAMEYLIGETNKDEVIEDIEQAA